MARHVRILIQDIDGRKSLGGKYITTKIDFDTTSKAISRLMNRLEDRRIDQMLSDGTLIKGGAPSENI